MPLYDISLIVRAGALVDATIIDAPSSTKNDAPSSTKNDAPSSTKNKARARDPEMSSTKKGNDWFFGMKAHIGVDAESCVTHSLETSTAKLHDSRVWGKLLHGKLSLQQRQPFFQ
jgi:IS5 family transposase